jgi:purine-binding chemotaxis protein CheW
MTRTEGDGRFLLCRIGSALGALALEDVREIMRPLPIEALAATPPFVLGLAIIRGAPTPVIDAGRLLGPATLASPARFVSLKVGERTAALAVDAVLDVRAIAAEMQADIPPLLRQADSDMVCAIGALDAKLLLVLQSARLLPESIWGAIQALGTPA